MFDDFLEAGMAGRRPGPAPKAPESRLRTNPDAVVGRDGWTEFDGRPFGGPVPEIPSWVSVSDAARQIYTELARLPQASLWGPGTWLELHLALPLIDRYLTRPGSESFKALLSGLGAGLMLTENDMQKARVRVRKADEPAPGAAAAGVTNIRSRRSRLSG